MTDTATHTPGEWQVKRWERDGYADGFEYVITDSRGHGIAVLCHKGDSTKNRANATLIAAAPTLLEHIQDLLIVADEADQDSLAQKRARATLAALKAATPKG